MALETRLPRGTVMDEPPATMNVSTLEQTRAAKQAALELFSALAPMVGVGITRMAGGYGLKVNLRTEPAAGTHWPTEVSGVPVRVEVVGPIKKRAAA